MPSDENPISIEYAQNQASDMAAAEAWLAMNAGQERDAVERFARIQEQLAAFQQIALKVGSESSLDSILALICDKTTQLMRAERTTIFQLEGDWLKSVIAEKSEVIRVRLGQGLAGTVAQKRKTLNLVDAYQSELFDPSFDKKSGFVTHSCLTMPILNPAKELLGVVQVINKKNGRFTLADEEMLESICSQIGVSLTQQKYYQTLWDTNAELRSARENLEHKNNELDMLYELERDAANAPDLRSLIESLLSRCRSAFRIEYAGLVLFSGARTDLFSMSQTRVVEERHPDRLPTFLSATIRRGTCDRLSIRNIQTLPEQTERSFGILLNTLVIAPFSEEDECAGALILGTQKPLESVFSSGEIKLASLLAAHIATAVGTHINREKDEKKQRLFAIGQMLSALLHDMKTPLQNILGYTEIMVSQPDEARRAKMADVVTRQVSVLQNMSAEILQFARGESAVIMRHDSLHAVLPEIVEQLTPEAGRRNIEISLDENYHGSFSFDRLKVQRLTQNLIKNAMEAIGENGHVRVSTRSDATHVFLTVEDDGPGIPPSIAGTLFDAFVTSGKKGGTGLGLSIVKKIVDEHGAKISWRNVEPHGTAFDIEFPIS